MYVFEGDEACKNQFPYIMTDSKGKVTPCGICTYNFLEDDEFIVLACHPESHILHKFCIERWFKRLLNYPWKCPICR